MADPGSGSDVTFSSLSDAIPSGTRYYWITVDISATATIDDNMHGTIDVSGDFSITNGSLSGSSNYGKANAGSEAPLPVELSSFTATAGDGQITLNWTTASEIGGVGFIIDRRTVETIDRQQIASYISDNSLVCLDNQLGNAEYTYVDNSAKPNSTYFYRLSDVDINGSRTVLDEIQVTTTAVASNSQTTLPEKTELMAAYPNPFNPQTKICYQLAEAAEVDVLIHNILGQRVRQLVSGMNQPAGSFNLFWDARNNAGEKMNSGVYFIMFRAGDFVKTQKVVLMR